MASPVTLDRDGRVGIVTLCSPDTRNALTTELLDALVAAVAECDADPSVRVVVLTGGQKVFASGADVRELLSLTPADYLVSARLVAWRKLMAIGKPMVSAVAGYVLGGGCELALCADLVVAADTAVFGQPEIRLGIIPGAGGTQRWGRVAGRFVAAEIVLLAGTVDAYRARRLGLVHRVCPAERIVEAGVEVARSLAAMAPLAARQAKAALRAADELSLAAALDVERSLLVPLMSTQDKAEGITAFLEKRPARFHGR